MRGFVNVVGFPFDGTACFRKGAADAPTAIREVSDSLETFSPTLNLDLEDVQFFDLGDLTVQTRGVTQSWAKGTDNYYKLFSMDLDKTNTKTLVLGGEHSVSVAPIRRALECFPDLVVIQLDAHADLRDGYQGFHWSHAAVMRRVLDYFGPKHQLIQHGIRSGTRREFEWMMRNGTRCSSLESLLTKIYDLPNDRPIYLTLDLDYFDPAFLPGTGTPEPGGESFHSFVAVTQTLLRKRLIGADVTELAPTIDPTGNSSVLAAKAARELILLLTQPTKRATT